MSISNTAMTRIREEMREQNMSQRDLAEKLKCSQGRIAKLLNGGVNLRLEDIALLATTLGLPVTEVIRDRGLEFYAELTPTELRILERLRQRPELRDAFLQILGLGSGSAKLRKKVGRPLNSSKQA